MADQKRDYYEVLGVDKTADDNAIKSAYRKLAKKYHPDMNPGDKDAEAKFKECSEAYAVLSDPDKRRQYDQFGHSAFDGSHGGGGFDFSGMNFSDMFSDIFGDFFGGGSRRRGEPRGPMRGANLRAQVSISFQEAAFGCEKEIEIVLKEACPSCKGSGCRAGTGKKKCQKCGGKGQIVMTQQSFFGTIQNVTTCPSCHGTGETIESPCPDCRGTGFVSKKKRLSVKIPAGIDDGQAVRIRDKGEPGENGGPRGDLLVEVRIRPDKNFARRDYDVYSEASISFAQAALGGEAIIETIDGRVSYTVKPGTQTGTTIRLRGKGIPTLRNPDNRGDHYVTLTVYVPTSLNNEAKEALRHFDSLSGNTLTNPQAPGKPEKKKRGFRDKVKNVFDDA